MIPARIPPSLFPFSLLSPLLFFFFFFFFHFLSLFFSFSPFPFSSLLLPRALGLLPLCSRVPPGLPCLAPKRRSPHRAPPAAAAAHRRPCTRVTPPHACVNALAAPRRVGPCTPRRQPRGCATPPHATRAFPGRLLPRACSPLHAAPRCRPAAHAHTAVDARTPPPPATRGRPARRRAALAKLPPRCSPHAGQACPAAAVSTPPSPQLQACRCSC